MIHVAFVLGGILTTFLGPTLPIFQSWYVLTDAEAGSLFAAQFAGATLSTLAAGAVLARYGASISLGVGFTLVTGALLGLLAGGVALVRASLFLLGAGLGLSIPTTNVWVAAQVEGRAKAAVLNSINLAWGLGAAICPILVSGSVRLLGGLRPLLVILAFLCFIAAALAARNLPRRRAAPTRTLKAAAVLAVALPFTLFLFLYTGVETAVGGWAATYAKREFGDNWILAPTLFWTGLLGGRAAATAARGSLDERWVLRTGAAVATAAIGAWMFATGPGILILAFVIGVALAPLYATSVAVFEARLGSAGMAAAGPIFAVAGLGAGVVPWCVGLASVRFGGLEAGLYVVLAASVGVLVLTMRGLEPGGAG